MGYRNFNPSTRPEPKKFFTLGIPFKIFNELYTLSLKHECPISRIVLKSIDDILENVNKEGWEKLNFEGSQCKHN